MTLLEADVRLRQGEFLLDACFTAPADSITALFGPSGAGKSTLLSVLAGLKGCEGRIALNGRVCADGAAGLHVPPHQRGFGLVFQEARLFPHLTAGQNLAYARRRAPASRYEIGDVAAFFDIAGLLERPVGNLSGGEKSRVALARALLAAPEFLLLDEPFAALDGARRRAFIDVLLAAQRRYQIPMMVVTHNIDDAASMASHLIALKQGKVVAQGLFAAVAQQAQFQALLDRRDIGAVLSTAALRSAKDGSAGGLWLRADHVLIAVAPPQGLSARNILEGRISMLRAEPQGSLLVTLETEAGPVLARVTPEAARELDLKPGKPAWAVVKAQAV
jgi:molybdate transport system ATP-binding protein